MQGYLRHLANFAHIVEAGSITGAANKLECSPSSMSESVRILEAHFKEPLLERRQRGVLPTSKGAAIYQDCRTIVQSCENIMSTSSDVISGRIKVSMPGELLIRFGSKLIERVRNEAPDIGLVLAAENQILDHTKFARDLYVRVSKEEAHPNLNTLHSNPEHVVLVGTEQIGRSFDIHDAQSVCSCTYLSGLQSGVDQKLRLSRPDDEIVFPHVIQIGSTEARIALMKQGSGITACLHSSVGEEMREGSLVRMLPRRFGFPVHVTIGAPHQNPSPACRLIAEAFAQLQSGS